MNPNIHQSTKPHHGVKPSPAQRLRALAQVTSKLAKRVPMHLAIRGLTSWTPLEKPEPGYTVIIACMHELASVAAANLAAISRMQLSHMRELILIFNCTEDKLPPSVMSLVETLRPKLPVRVLCYTPQQEQAAAKLRWGWVYAWLSWCIGVGAARTRHVILHDLDALPLHPSLFDHRYQQAMETGSQFHGVRWYQGNGVTEAMQLVVTFELVLDAQHVRRSFRPFDVFNHVATIEGNYVDFDTFLYTQWRSEHRTVQVLPESELVHPSQMICQYTDFVAGRNTFTTQGHNLLLLPYYSYLGGDTSSLEVIGNRCADLDATSVPFVGKELPIAAIRPHLWAWLEKQIRRTEQALFGKTRPEVENYLRGFITRSGKDRTVGAETGENAVAAR